MSNEPKTGLPFWPAGALQQDLIFNELLRFIGAVGAPATVKDKDLAAPPGSPANGDTYIVAGSPTGAWSGHAKDIAYYDNGTWVFYTPSEGWRVDVADEDIPYRYSGSAWAAATALAAYDQIVAIGDETTAITTGVNKVTFRAARAFTLTAVKASLTAASSSGLPQFDINVNGSSILSTKLTINASSKTSVGATTPAVISGAPLAIAADDEITIDIDTAGTGAAGAKISLIGTA